MPKTDIRHHIIAVRKIDQKIVIKGRSSKGNNA